MATPATAQEFRFGEYSLNARTGELRRNGTVVKLQPQPAKVLSILVARAGEIVTRQELADEVWGSETYVDFEHGLNYAIQQIRSVLEDNPKAPQFLETVPKRGYRFIPTLVAAEREHSSAGEGVARAGARKSWSRVYLAIAAVGSVAAITAAAWLFVRGREARSASGTRIQSVAVLPLRNLSNDAEQEYFSDGITDELITDLANSGGLRVISHTSVERYKGTKLSLPEIARALAVDAVVEGTIMRSEGKVRITAQLIDARTDHHLWAASYERDLRDVLQLQDEVAQRIATEIGSNVNALAPRQHASLPPVDPAAHEAYLRGLFYWSQLTCSGYGKGRDYFQQAVDRDPSFAPAYVGLAQSYFALSDGGCSSEHDLGRKAKQATLKALDLDRNSAEAHAWLGKIAFYYEWDFPRAEREFTRAIALGPNYATAHFLFGVFLITTERREQGVGEIRKALDLDPVSHVTNAVGTFALYLAHQYDPAIDQGKRTVDLFPASATAYDWLGAAYEQKGSYDQAIAAYSKAKELRGVTAKELNASRTAFGTSDIHGYWRRELETLTRRPQDPCSIAGIYAHLGNQEKTLEFLQLGFQQDCVEPHIILSDPIYDGVRRDTRFSALVRSRLVAN